MPAARFGKSARKMTGFRAETSEAGSRNVGATLQDAGRRWVRFVPEATDSAWCHRPLEPRTAQSNCPFSREELMGGIRNGDSAA